MESATVHLAIRTEISPGAAFCSGHEGAEYMLRLMYGVVHCGKTKKKTSTRSLSEIALLAGMMAPGCRVCSL